MTINIEDAVSCGEMKYLMLLVGTTVLMSAAVVSPADANSSRLTVLNAVIEPVPGVKNVFQLYLSRLGTYYAELYLESEHVPRHKPIDLALTVSFLRREKLMLSRELEIQFVPGKNVATLFFFDVPYDLPQRKNIEVVVSFSEVDPRLKDHFEVVRLQMTRKVQIVPFKP